MDNHQSLFRRHSLFTFSIGLAFLAVSGGALAEDMPIRKSGLWEIKTTVTGMEGAAPPIRHCIDEKTDDMMRESVDDKESQCTDNSVRHEGERVMVHSVCKVGETTATTDAVFSGEFSSNYRGEIVATYDPPMMGMKESKSVIEAKWLGPCKPGMKPGDITMPGMPEGLQNLNLNELMKQHQPGY
jgi:hypothetical protein